MPHKVFIGYSLEDKLVADAACAALEAQRIPCWIAPRDILTNDENGEAISDMLAQCPIVLLIFSAKAIDSPEVRREIDWAVSKGKIIVPLRIDDIPASDAFKFVHGRTHWLDALTPPLEANLTKVCDKISRLLAEHKVADAPLWTLHDESGAENTSQVIVPESVKQHSVAADAISESIPAPTLSSVPEQTIEPHIVQANAHPSTVQPIPLPVYSWPAPPQSPSAVSKPVYREEVNESVLHSAPYQTVHTQVAQDAAHSAFTESPTIFPTLSPPLMHLIESKPRYSEDEDGSVAHKRYWTSPRMTFIILFCIAALIMVFLFLRQSRQSPVKANSVPSSALESPVTPFLNPSQPNLTPVNNQQSGLSNANTEAPQQVLLQKEVVPALAQPALLAQQVASTKTVQATSETPMKQGATSVQPTPVDEESNLVWIDFATGLMWAKKDSGDRNDLTWNAASEYCKNLQLDGHSDWRLPTIDQLQGIYDSTRSIEGQCCGGQSKIWHVKGGLKLSGPLWSSTTGEGAQKAVYLNMNAYEQITAPISNSESLRALCVRKAGD